MIFTILKGPNLWDDAQIVVRSLDTGQQTVLLTGGADGRYVSTGHLIYVRLGTLMAVPFDPVRLAVTGGATGVIDGVMQAADRNRSYMDNTLAGHFTVSDTGSLVYLTGGAVAAGDRLLAWVDRHGTGQALPAPPRPYSGSTALARRPARGCLHPGPVRCGASTSHAARSARSPLTGRAITGLLRQMENGSSSARVRRAVRATCIGRRPTGVGPSNALPPVRAARRHPPGHPTGRRSPLWKREIPRQGVFSVRYLGVVDWRSQDPRGDPDGGQRDDTRILPGWPVAGVRSNESGRHEVYVQPYPGPGERHLISTNGGEQPAWSRDGRELFYVQRGAPPAAVCRR